MQNFRVFPPTWQAKRLSQVFTLINWCIYNKTQLPFEGINRYIYGRGLFHRALRMYIYFEMQYLVRLHTVHDFSVKFRHPWSHNSHWHDWDTILEVCTRVMYIYRNCAWDFPPVVMTYAHMVGYIPTLTGKQQTLDLY